MGGCAVVVGSTIARNGGSGVVGGKRIVARRNDAAILFPLFLQLQRLIDRPPIAVRTLQRKGIAREVGQSLLCPHLKEWFQLRHTEDDAPLRSVFGIQNILLGSAGDQQRNPPSS